MDKLEIEISNSFQTTPLLDNGSFERRNYNSAWTEWHPSDQNLAFGVDSGSGTNPPESPKEGDSRAYFYSEDEYHQSIHQSVSTSNGSYQIQAWVQVSNADPTIGRMEVSGFGGDPIYIDMPSSGEGWELLTVDQVQVSTGYIDVGFYCASPGGTTIHIDGVKLIKK